MDRDRTKIIQILFVALTLGLMAFIFYNSAQPADISAASSNRILIFLRDTLGLPLTSHIVRKTAHFLEFAALGFVLLRAIGCDLACFEPALRRGEQAPCVEGPLLGSGRLNSAKRKVAAALLIGWIYAASDELHQLFVEGRSCELRDWSIDAAGVLCGVLVMLLFLKIISQIVSSKARKNV